MALGVCSQTMIIKNQDSPCESDNRCKALSTTRDTYLAGSGWIEITASEYSNLPNKLTGTDTYGATDAQITSAANDAYYYNMTTSIINSNSEIPINEHYVAVKIKADDTDGMVVKRGTNSSLVSVGAALSSCGGTCYFIYKGDEETLHTTSRASLYTGLNSIGSTSGSSTTWRANNTGSSNANTESEILAYQFLMTDTKQW